MPVSISAEEDKLGETRNATLILRLVLDWRGRLKYGELVVATNGFEERFIEWRGLMRVLRVWLTNQAFPKTPDHPQTRI